MVDVLQRHRDAAANFYRGAEIGIPGLDKSIREGRHDDDELVQAFAASEARLIARLGEPDIVEAIKEIPFDDQVTGGVIYLTDSEARAILAAVSDALNGE